MASADNSLAGASDTTGDPLSQRRADEAVEITPIIMYGKGDLESEHQLYDFVPHEEEEVVGLEDEDEGDVGPKDSSAPGSALSKLYREVMTPMPERLGERETTASAEKDSTSDAASGTGSESSTPTSSTPPKTTSGNETQPAPDPA